MMTPLSGPRTNGYYLRAASLILALAAFQLPAAASVHNPTAGEVLDRYVDATGGTAVWHARKSERDEIEGRALDDNRVILSAAITTTRSGNTLSEVHVPQEGLEGVFKGIAWAMSPFSGVRIKHGTEREEAIRDARMLDEADWRTLYPAAKLTKVETAAGRRCYKVQLTPGRAEWFDVETGLLVQRRSSELSSGGETPVGFTVEEWGNRGGLKQPVRMLAFRGDLQYRLRVLSTVWNDVSVKSYPPAVAEYLAAMKMGKALPNPEEIIERHIYESGGIDAYANLKTQQVKGSLAFLSSNTEASVETWAADGGKYLQTIDLPGLGKQEEGSDGQFSWERSPALGPRVKLRTGSNGIGVTLDAAQVIGWRFLVKEVRTEALEKIDGHDCYRVRLTPRDGSQAMVRWYDRQTGLLYRASASLPSDMGALPALLTFEEYREAEGLKWPTRIRISVSGQNLLFTAADVRLNQPLEGAIFDLPREIRQIIEKKSVDSL